MMLKSYLGLVRLGDESHTGIGCAICLMLRSSLVATTDTKPGNQGTVAYSNMEGPCYKIMNKAKNLKLSEIKVKSIYCGYFCPELNVF